MPRYLYIWYFHCGLIMDSSDSNGRKWWGHANQCKTERSVENKYADYAKGIHCSWETR